MFLSRQKPLRCIELRHSPNSRHAYDAILDGHLRDQGVLLEQSDEDLVCKQEEHNSGEDNKRSVDEPSHVEILTALLSHFNPVHLCLLHVLRKTEGVGDQGFEGAVEAKGDAEAESGCYDSSESNCFDKSLCVLVCFDPVVARKRDEEAVDYHREPEQGHR